jgi:hypothetical protein
MKLRTICLIYLLFFSTEFLLAQSSYVNAIGGLRMRETPSTDGKVVITIPDGEGIYIVEQKENQDTIGGRDGNWTKVEYNSKIGWVFGGFLNPRAGKCIKDDEMLQTNSIFNIPKHGDFWGGVIKFKPDGTAVMEAEGLRTGLKLDLQWNATKKEIRLEGEWGKTEDELIGNCTFGCQGSNDMVACSKACDRSEKGKGYIGRVTYTLKGASGGKRSLSEPKFKVLSGPKQTYLSWEITMVAGAEDCIREKKD